MLERAFTRDLLLKYRQNIITPVIVKAKGGYYDQLRSELIEIKRQTSPVGMGLLRVPQVSLFSFKELPRFGMLALPLTSDIIEDLSDSPKVELIYPDYIKYALQEGIFTDNKGKKFTTTYYSKRVIGADRANQEGFTGKGIKVVVIDSGLRTTHPQARGMIARTAAPEKLMTGEDANGHGTWCGTCIAGAYQVDPAYKVPVEGVAPEAQLTMIQALGFVVGTGSSSDIISAMSMAIDYGADIVSMSLGSNDAPPDAENPEAVAVNALVARDIIPVIAAGNSGPAPQTIGSPGSCLNALTVGAWSTIDNQLASFSSRGPTKGDGLIKPDVIAPGVRIDSATVGLIDAMAPGQPRYASISGTSMATPHVAGLLALARQMYAREGVLLTPEIVKEAMKLHGHSKNNETGYGMITWDILKTHMPHVRGAPKMKYGWEET